MLESPEVVVHEPIEQLPHRRGDWQMFSGTSGCAAQLA